MATAKPNEEHETVPEVDHPELLRVSTFERFRVGKSPARATDRTAPAGRQRTKTPWMNASGVPNVRGRGHDGENTNTSGRAR
jgi:hypothetical protein